MDKEELSQNSASDYESQVQYVHDASGKTTSVLVPIGLWEEIASEKETQYLLKSPAMAQRLKEAQSRDTGMNLDDLRAKLGI